MKQKEIARRNSIKLAGFTMSGGLSINHTRNLIIVVANI